MYQVTLASGSWLRHSCDNEASFYWQLKLCLFFFFLKRSPRFYWLVFKLPAQSKSSVHVGLPTLYGKDIFQSEINRHFPTSRAFLCSGKVCFQFSSSNSVLYWALTFYSGPSAFWHRTLQQMVTCSVWQTAVWYSQDFLFTWGGWRGQG